MEENTKATATEAANDDIVISVDHVTMSFNLSKEKVDNLKEYFIKFLILRNLPQN